MVFYVPRTCRDCGDTRIVTSPNTAARRQIAAGEKRCHSCWQRIVTAHLGPIPARSRDDVDPVVVERLVAGRPARATVAERLEAVRALAGLTGHEIAERLGVSLRSVQRYRSELRREIPS